MSSRLLTLSAPYRFIAALALAGYGLSACDRPAPEPVQEGSASSSDNRGNSAPPASGAQSSVTIDRSEAGALMPMLELTDPAGNRLNTGALQGTPVLLNLWATWCAPCVKEMPLLDEVAADYGDQLRVVTVSQDLQGAARVVPFFEARDFQHLEAWLDESTRLSQAISPKLPTTVLYDASGQEVWRVVGDFDWSSAEARGAIDEAF